MNNDAQLIMFGVSVFLFRLLSYSTMDLFCTHYFSVKITKNINAISFQFLREYPWMPTLWLNAMTRPLLFTTGEMKKS